MKFKAHNNWVGIQVLASEASCTPQNVLLLCWLQVHCLKLVDQVPEELRTCLLHTSKIAITDILVHVIVRWFEIDCGMVLQDVWSASFDKTIHSWHRKVTLLLLSGAGYIHFAQHSFTAPLPSDRLEQSSALCPFNRAR